MFPTGDCINIGGSLITGDDIRLRISRGGPNSAKEVPLVNIPFRP